MLECFLLLLQRGAKWTPLILIPILIAGSVASICLIVSGIKGILTEPLHPKRGVARATSPEHVVQWIAPRHHGHQSG